MAPWLFKQPPRGSSSSPLWAVALPPGPTPWSRSCRASPEGSQGLGSSRLTVLLSNPTGELNPVWTPNLVLMQEFELFISWWLENRDLGPYLFLNFCGLCNIGTKSLWLSDLLHLGPFHFWISVVICGLCNTVTQSLPILERAQTSAQTIYNRVSYSQY